MTNRERNVLILVLAILAACGFVALVSPAPVEPDARATPESTLVPTTASTFVSSSTRETSSTPTPTPTAAPTSTPVPAEVQATTSKPASPLAMDWVLIQKGCVSETQWVVEFWITATGGTGEYIYYRDRARLYGPAREPGYAYRIYPDTGSAAEGTFVVESGAQRVRSEYWVERLDCASPAPSPTSGALVSPLEPGSSP